MVKIQAFWRAKTAKRDYKQLGIMTLKYVMYREAVTFVVHYHTVKVESASHLAW